MKRKAVKRFSPGMKAPETGRYALIDPRTRKDVGVFLVLEGLTFPPTPRSGMWFEKLDEFWMGWLRE